MSDLSKKSSKRGERVKHAKVRQFLKIYIAAMIIYSVIAILWVNEFFFYISTMLFIANIVLVVKYPQYFSIRAPYKKEKRKEYFVAGFLLFPMLSSVGIFFLKIKNVSNPFPILSLVIAVMIGTVLIVCFRKEWITVKFSAVGVYMISFLIAIGIVITLAYPSAHRNLVSSQTAEVVETDSRRTGRKYKLRNYFCTVKFSDGTVQKYHIARSVYKELQNGDTVQVDIYEGIFGITFTYVNN